MNFDKLKLPIGLALTICGAMLTAGMAWSDLKNGQAESKAQIAEIKPQVTEAQGAIAELKTSQAVMLQMLQDLKDGMDRTEKKLGTKR